MSALDTRVTSAEADLAAATNAAQANQLARRDGNGRLKVSDPSADGDATPKTYVDAEVAGHNHDAAYAAAAHNHDAAYLNVVDPAELADADKLTQAQYDALGAGRPATRVYFVVG